MDYANGKIYRIICEETGRQYIGSTCSTLTKRLSNHKQSKGCSCKDFINPKIILIEDYPCERKDQLLMRERYWMENLECVNIRRSIISEEERKINHQNKYIRRKDIIGERSKQRYIDNKEKINNHAKEKITCECGTIVCRRHISTHKKSKKHQKLLGSVEL